MKTFMYGVGVPRRVQRYCTDAFDNFNGIGSMMLTIIFGFVLLIAVVFRWDTGANWTPADVAGWWKLVCSFATLSALTVWRSVRANRRLELLGRAERGELVSELLPGGPTPLQLLTARICGVVRRFNRMAERWNIYRNACEAKLIDPLPDERAIQTALEKAQREIEEHLRVGETLIGLEQIGGAPVIDQTSLSDALEALRDAERALADHLLINTDRVLAEPIETAKLDALNADLASIRIPTPRKATS